MENKKLLEIENASILFRNFSGAADKYTQAGQRSFHVALDPDSARDLAEDGWNVKCREPKDAGEEAFYHMKVSVRFDNYPPKIVMITSRNQVELNENTVGMLDNADIKSVDLIISPSKWNVNGKEGIKAYLKTMYVVIEEDAFAAKYQRPEVDKEDIPFA